VVADDTIAANAVVAGFSAKAVAVAVAYEVDPSYEGAYILVFC
jgi:hypothetical protein